MVLKPGTPENCGVLKTVMTDASCTSRPLPLLVLLSVDPASRSRPAFEFTDTPATGLPEALMVPPKEMKCAPDTIVRPTLKLLFAVITDWESAIKPLAPVAI